MIERFKRCVGLRIPLWKSRQIELWFCPKAEIVPPHFHHTIESFIISLWGRQRWTVGDKTRDVLGPIRRRNSNGSLTLAAYRIGCGVRHAVEALSFSIFLNIEQCRGPKVSASRDFVATP